MSDSLKLRTSLWYGGRYSIMRLKVTYTISCKDGYTPFSTAKFGWSVKMRSMHDEELGNRWVDSDINWCKPCDTTKESNWIPFTDVISPGHCDLEI